MHRRSGGPARTRAGRCDRWHRGGELSGVGLDAGIPRARAHEGIGEVAGPAAHVDDVPAAQVTPPGDLGHRVGGQHRVEEVRVGLLDEEGPEQPDRPANAAPGQDTRGRCYR